MPSFATRNLVCDPALHDPDLHKVICSILEVNHFLLDIIQVEDS